ncbi:hypothetical protein FPOAC1_007742 [Fusarium poae]|uniref:hypothetical protein n=1 Tax=Fusarium poae TaxID=36050 RepID=UPI001CEBB298|nr:hypothetical protein FPOAC1_007742 [Fusarium poae]KAG8668363.1 hypothetical protein FPOAC1_007742 [Fusarium poae]
MESFAKKQLKDSIPQAFRLHGILANDTNYATDSDDEIESWDDTDSEDDSSDVDEDSSDQGDSQADSSQDDIEDEQNQDQAQDNKEQDQENPPLAFEELSANSQLTRQLRRQPDGVCLNSVLRPGLWVVDPNLDMKNYPGGFLRHLANVCFQANLRECAHERCIDVKTSMDQLAPSCSWEPFRRWALTAMSCQTSMDDERKLTRAHTHIARAVSGCFKVIKFHLKKNSLYESDDFEKVDLAEVVNLMYWMTRIQADLGTPPAKISDWDHHFVPFKYTIKSVQRAAREVDNLRICKNRLWNLVNVSDRKHGDLPDIVMSLSDCGEPLAHQKHDICTPSKCQDAQMDSTKVEQLHKCEGKDCEQKTFPVELLATNIEVGKSTAWVCNTSKASPQLNFNNKDYIAISHVWSDGTGVGVKNAGTVNKCLYDFFEQTAIRLDCGALWWDAISIPQELKARMKAMKDMHSNYTNAKYTVVHDSYLLNFPWSDDGSPCLALVLSTWFTRGWTALELAMAQKVKVLFKDPDPTKTEPIIKDLDDDVLAKSPQSSTRAHWLATCLVQRIRKPVEHIGDLVAILGPRCTSWARDRTIIASLLAGVPDVDLTIGESVITRSTLEYLGKIPYFCLLHGKPTMYDKEGYSWSPATLDDMPIEVVGGTQKVDDDMADTMLEIDDNGSLWGICACRVIDEQEVIDGKIKPYGDSLAATIKVNLALADPSSCLLVRPSANNKDPRCILVVPIGILQDGPTIKCRYIGTVLEDEIVGYGPKTNILIGGHESEKTQPLDADKVLNEWLWDDAITFDRNGEMELRCIQEEEDEEEDHGLEQNPLASETPMQNDSWTEQQVTELADELEHLDLGMMDDPADMTPESLRIALKCKNRSATRFLVNRDVTVDLEDFVSWMNSTDDDPPMNIARSLGLLGDVYMEHGQIGNAIDAYETALQQRERMSGEYDKSTTLVKVNLSLGRAWLVLRQLVGDASDEANMESTNDEGSEDDDGSEDEEGSEDDSESEFQLDDGTKSRFKLGTVNRAKELFQSIVDQGKKRGNFRTVDIQKPGDEGGGANTVKSKANDGKEETRRDERRGIKFLRLELDAVAELIRLAVGEFRFDDASEICTESVRHFGNIANIELCEGFKPRWIERNTKEATAKESRDKEAASIYHRVLKRLSTLFKKHHLLIVITKLHLGVNCIFRSELRDAVTHLSDAIRDLTCHSNKDTQERGSSNIQFTVRPDHPLIALARYYLGHAYLEQERLPKALNELTQALGILPSKGHDSMVLRSVIRIDLANYYLKGEGLNPMMALNTLNPIFDEFQSMVQSQAPGGEHTQVLASNNELYARLEIEARFIQAKAVYYSAGPGNFNQNNFDLALKISMDALAGTRKLPKYKPESDLEEERCLSFLSKIHEDFGSNVEALKYRQSSLKILETVEGEHSLSWLKGAISLARIYDKLNVLYEESEILLKKAIEGLEKDLGEYSTKTLQTCQQLGQFYLDHNHTHQAEKYCTRAFEGFEKARGATSKYTLNAALVLGKILSRNFKYTKATEVLLKAHTAYNKEAMNSPNNVHKKYIVATRELAECFAALGGPGNERTAIQYNNMILKYLEDRCQTETKDYCAVLLQQGNLLKQLREFDATEYKIRLAIGFFEKHSQPGSTYSQEIEALKYEGYFRLGELILDMQRLDIPRKGFEDDKKDPEDLIVEAHEGLKRILGDEDLLTIEVSVLRGELCLDHDDEEDPERDRYLYESLESCRRVLPHGTPMTIRIMDRLINYWVDNKCSQDKIDTVRRWKLEDLRTGYGQDTAVAIMKMTDLKRENLFSLETIAPEHHYEDHVFHDDEESVEDDDLPVWDHRTMQNDYAIQNQPQQSLGLQIGEQLGGIVHAGVTLPFDVVQGFVNASLTGVVGGVQQARPYQAPTFNPQPSYGSETSVPQMVDQRQMSPQPFTQQSYAPQTPVPQMVYQREATPQPLIQPLFDTGASLLQFPLVATQSFLNGFQEGLNGQSQGNPGCQYPTGQTYNQQGFSGQIQGNPGYQNTMEQAYQEENQPAANQMTYNVQQGYGNQNTNQNNNGGWFGFGGFGG